MDEALITKVAAVLSEWNPLGTQGHTIADLDGYRTEAIDIVATFDSPFGGATEGSRGLNVMNQASRILAVCVRTDHETLQKNTHLISVLSSRLQDRRGAVAGSPPF